jgi:hypothetical protein
MDFVIHNLSNCEAHHGEVNGDSVQFINVTNITNTPVHHVVAIEGVRIEKEQVLFVELQKNQQLWHCHNQISPIWVFFVLNNLVAKVHNHFT